MFPNQLYIANNYLFKDNNRNTRTSCEICSKVTKKTPERRQWRRSGVFIVNLNIFHTLFQCFYFWLRTSNCLLGSNVSKSSYFKMFLIFNLYLLRGIWHKLHLFPHRHCKCTIIHKTGLPVYCLFQVVNKFTK